MSAEDVRAAVEGAEPFELVEPADGGGKKRRRRDKSDATLLLDLIRETTDADSLWCDDDGNAYATLLVVDHSENHAVRSGRFRTLATGMFWQRHGRVIGAQAMEEVQRTCEAIALSEGPCFQIFRRVAEAGGKLYLDLGGEKWRLVEIDAHGYRVITCAPPGVKFIRSKGMRALPEPEPGGMIDELRAFLNVSDDQSFRMIAAFLIACLRPTGPYPILMISGEQGSAKSTTARVCRMLVDPNVAPSRAPPRDERDLISTASNSHMMSYDNISTIQAWLSDGYARVSTGSGYAARELHTNMDEVVFEGQRPIILNGIPDLGGRADLGDRALTVHLPPIPDDQRRTAREFWAAFDQHHPTLLGALLDAASAALRELPNVRLPRIPRMADFAEWVTAAEPGLGWEPGSFLAAYDANRESVNEMAVEASLLGQVVEQFARNPPAMSPEPTCEHEAWRGTATELLPLLGERVSEAVRNSREWPRNASALGSQLRRINPVLRRRGVEVAWMKGGAKSTRLVSILVAPT